MTETPSNKKNEVPGFGPGKNKGSNWMWILISILFIILLISFFGRETNLDDVQETHDKVHENEEGAQNEHTSQEQNIHQLLALKTYKIPSSISDLQPNENRKKYSQAVEAFNQQNFDEALKLINESASTSTIEQDYVKGHIYFNLKEFEKAKIEFAKVSVNKRVPNALEAEWYLMLSYMVQHPKYVGAFEELALKLAEDQYSDYSNKTRALLVDLAEMMQ